jgi:hypothetical protein
LADENGWVVWQMSGKAVKRKRTPDAKGKSGAAPSGAAPRKGKSPARASTGADGNVANKRRRTDDGKSTGAAGARGKSKSPAGKGKGKEKIAGLNPKKKTSAVDDAGPLTSNVPQKYKNPRYLTPDGKPKPYKPKTDSEDGEGEKKTALTREDRKQLRKARRAAKPGAEVAAVTNTVYNVSAISLFDRRNN